MAGLVFLRRRLFGLVTLMAFAGPLSGEDRPVSPGKPSVVRLVAKGEKFQLLRDGKPYFINGAGGDGSRRTLAEAGGNSIRTWSTDNLQSILDEAHQFGLTVTVGFWLGHERHGFNYNDPVQVIQQADQVRKTVEQFKHHPAVLIWAIGNEMEGSGENAAIWLAVNHLAGVVKQLDPDHPTMTVIAELGEHKVNHFHELCPNIEILGINSYGTAATVPERYRKAGGIKPYIMTEFGPAGTWELPKNAWGMVPEATSTEKAAVYRQTYQQAVANQPGWCLGSYAFLWGVKQEATATWFGILLPDGTRLGAADVLTEMWTGKPPKNRCPRIEQLTIVDGSDVDPQTVVKATLKALDPDADPIQVRWKLQQEGKSFGEGGDAEAVPPEFPEAIVKSTSSEAEVRLPKEGGSYRLFAFVTDDHGGGAVANVPLHVKGAIAPQAPAAAPSTLPLVLYDEADRKNPPYSPTGWMGNQKSLKLNDQCETKPHTGKTCLRVDYLAKESWGGVVWQSPANDWGDLPGGRNLTGAKQLSFWVRGENGGEVISVEFGIIKKDKRYHDSGQGKLSDIKLTSEWQQFSINVADSDLTQIKTGFVFVVAGAGRPITFYLDDVRYE